MSPPSFTLVHALGHNWLGMVNISIQTVLLAIALMVIGLRLWSRHLHLNSLHGNDWLIIAATVLMLGRYTVEVVLILLCGLGLHILEVERIGGAEILVRSRQLTYAGALLWTITVGLIQLSILHYLRQKYQARVTMWSAYVMMGLCSALMTASLLATAFFCTPPSKIWFADRDANCGDRKMLHTSAAISEMILDSFVLLISLPPIWHTRLSRFRMVSLGGIYAMGLFIIAISAALVKIEFDLDPGDPTYGSARKSLLSCIVSWLGIIVACLPLLSPAIQRIFSTSVLSSNPPKQDLGSIPAGYWKAPHSFTAQVEDPEIPLVPVRQPWMASKFQGLALGQITITSHWEIHSARNSARLDRDSIRRS